MKSIRLTVEFGGLGLRKAAGSHRNSPRDSRGAPKLTRFRVRARRPKAGPFLRARMFSRSSITRTTSGAAFCEASRGGASFIVVVVVVVLFLPFLLLFLLLSSSRRFPIGCCTEPGRSPGRASPAGKRAIYPRQPHSPTRTRRRGPARNLRSLPT